MCGRLDFYLNQFNHLKPAKNSYLWGAATCLSSPYKPFLLLSVFDLLESDRIQRNFISPSEELNRVYRSYVKLLGSEKRQGCIGGPFTQLDCFSFWDLRRKPGMVGGVGSTCRSLKRLRESYFGAKFSVDLFPLLQMEGSRRKLRRAIIDSYFSPEFARSMFVDRKTDGF